MVQKKNIRMYPLLAVGLILLLTGSCKKDENNGFSGPTVSDIDGNVYHTVTIGTQVWMVENLATTHYRNGAPIFNVTDSTQWNSQKAGAYCRYNSFRDPSTINDKLYNWYAVNDSRNIAPEGWHIPSDEEWNTMINYLGGMGVAGSRLKQKGTYFWLSPNSDATNESGFSAKAGGMINQYNVFLSLGYQGYWWSSAELDSENANYWSLTYLNGTVSTSHFLKLYGLTIRCIKD